MAGILSGLQNFFLPVVHYVCDDGGKEAEQHDRCAGIHDRVQKLPRVRGERQHLLQILKCRKTNNKKNIITTSVIIKLSVSKDLVCKMKATLKISPKNT